MATQVQLRRGTDSQHTSFTGAVGEITVNTTNDSAHVHDGATAGGFELARADGQNANMPASAMPAGSVIQVVQTVKRDTASTTSSSFSSIPGMDVSITPISTSSKILITVSISTTNIGVVNQNDALKLSRNGSSINNATGSSGTPMTLFVRNQDTNAFEVSSITYLDNPGTTSATTYGVLFAAFSGGTMSVNNEGSGLDARPISTITAMEIAG